MEATCLMDILSTVASLLTIIPNDQVNQAVVRVAWEVSWKFGLITTDLEVASNMIERTICRIFVYFGCTF